MSDNIFKVSKEDDLIEILDNVQNKLVVLMFSASWCGPCKQIKPKFIQQSEINKNVLFIYIDIEEYDECKKQNKKESFLDSINSMPTFLFYLNKNLIDNFTGASEMDLLQSINKGQMLAMKLLNNKFISNNK